MQFDVRIRMATRSEIEATGANASVDEAAAVCIGNELVAITDEYQSVAWTSDSLSPSTSSSLPTNEVIEDLVSRASVVVEAMDHEPEPTFAPQNPVTLNEAIEYWKRNDRRKQDRRDAGASL